MMGMRREMEDEEEGMAERIIERTSVERSVEGASMSARRLQLRFAETNEPSRQVVSPQHNNETNSFM